MKTALLILVLNSMVYAQGVSLGDAARQERARQKASTGNIKITNDTLGTSAALPPEAEDAKPESADGKTADGKDVKAEGKTDAKPEAKVEGPADEASWRAVFKQARDDVKRAEDRSQLAQLELNKLNMDLMNRSDIFNKENQLNPLIDAKNKELAAAEKAVVDARAKVTQLEDELRRSGAPIGWSR
jgi:hypothetical protein